MDKRYSNSGMTNSSHSTRNSNSFIPTSGSTHTKLPQHQIQQLALQSQLQAQSQQHSKFSANDHQSNNGQTYYQNGITNIRQIGVLPYRNNLNTLHAHSKNVIKQFSSHYGNTNNTSSANTNSSITNQSNSNGHIIYSNSVGQTQNPNSIIPNWRYSAPAQTQKDTPIPIIQPLIKQIQQQPLSNKVSQHYQPAETEGLPQTLVDSMRTLFDILDDTKIGKIRLSDIETRWENGKMGNGQNSYNTGAEPLIKMGVMGYLRKVTPPDGLLTFERFCAGLRLALLTNNNSYSFQNQLFITPIQIEPASQTNPQFSLQHVRNMASNIQSTNNMQYTSSAHPQATNVKSYNNNNETQTFVVAANVNNTVSQRISKIPSISASRLQMPISPNRHTTTGISYGNMNPGNPSSTVLQNGTLRSQTNAEKGTTTAMVHQAPNANNAKQLENSIYSNNNDVTIGTLKIKKYNSNSYAIGKETRLAIKNGSLDNLISDNEEKGSGKDRPPSAPLLDAADPFEGENEQQYYKNDRDRTKNNIKVERNRRLEKDTEDLNRKVSAEEMSFGKRVVSFVSPRQRTVSMPQLQLKTLKPKAINLEDDLCIFPDSSQFPESSGDIEKRPVNTKSNLKSHISPPTQLSSIPGLHKQKSESSVHADSLRQKVQNKKLNDTDQHHAPPKPPRNTALTITTILLNSTNSEPPNSSSSTGSGTLTPSFPEIRNVLQSWQKGMADKIPDESTKLGELFSVASAADTIQTKATENEIIEKGVGEKKTNLRRRETPRRHTVQCGFDFATLKRLKLLEQERDVLQQGSSCIENTRDWYIKQLETVDEKITLLTKGAPTSDYWSESQEERLNILGCRISEINSLLTSLMDGSSRLPLHMNLQIPSHLSMKTITRLKDQNRQLTQEISDCFHRVTQLETEKAMLLRQLFHQKNSIHQAVETVYM